MRLSDLDGWPLLPTLNGDRLIYVAHRALMAAIPADNLHLKQQHHLQQQQQLKQQQQAATSAGSVGGVSKGEEDPWADLLAVPKGQEGWSAGITQQQSQQQQERGAGASQPGSLLEPWSPDAPQLEDLVSFLCAISEVVLTLRSFVHCPSSRRTGTATYYLNFHCSNSPVFRPRGKEWKGMGHARA